jgi:hypothetical protein
MRKIKNLIEVPLAVCAVSQPAAGQWLGNSWHKRLDYKNILLVTGAGHRLYLVVALHI